MRYNVLLNSKNKVGGDNPSNYKYNFDFSPFEDGEYELGFNFNTNPLKTVQATPIYISEATTQNFIDYSLNVINTSLNYEYALSNGTSYEVKESSYTTSNRGWQMFNRNGVWLTANGIYQTSGVGVNGLYTGSKSTITDSGTIIGEYCQIKLPYKLKLTSFSVMNAVNTNQASIRDFSIVGSNDELNWVVILSSTVNTSVRNTLSNFSTPNNTSFYSYYRLIIKNIYTGAFAFGSTGTLSLFGQTTPVNNASLLQIELEGLGATNKAYTTTNLTVAKSSNVIGTIPLSKESYYNASYKFNNLVNILSKPLSSEITINLKDSDGNLFNIGDDYLMLLSFLKK